MKKKTLQWQLTLLTALLVVCACLTVSALISRSATVYLDKLENSVVRVMPTNHAETKAFLEYQVQSGASFARDVKAARNEFWRDSLIATGLVTVLCSLLTYVMIGRRFRPLRELEEKVTSVGERNLSPIVISDCEGEVRQLTDAFNEMIRRLAEEFEMLRRYSANAAHELKTPLAVMQAKIEVLQKQSALAAESRPTTAEYAETLAMVQRETAHLSKVISTVLQLADLDDAVCTEHIALEEVTEEVLCDLMPLAEKKHVTLSQHGGRAVVLGNDTLVYRAIYNLVENAIKYNHDGGEVAVEISDEPVSAKFGARAGARAGESVYAKHGARAGRLGTPESLARVRITDTGIGLPPDVDDKIFEPFYRVNKSFSRELGGTGLGLTLVHEIMRIHHGSVRVVKSGEDGTQFELVFCGDGRNS